jgi:hypothetical protein
MSASAEHLSTLRGIMVFRVGVALVVICATRLPMMSSRVLSGASMCLWHWNHPVSFGATAKDRMA